MNYIDCTVSCSDTNCLMECGRDLTHCVNGFSYIPMTQLKNLRVLSDCPFNVNCPNGCSDCLNPICVCGEKLSSHNEESLRRCMTDKSINLGQCIIDCKNDKVCESSCVELFKSEYEECPCQVVSNKCK